MVPCPCFLGRGVLQEAHPSTFIFIIVFNLIHVIARVCGSGCSAHGQEPSGSSGFADDTTLHTGRDRGGKRGGGERVIYCPIAWLPPGHDPGAAGGVATTALQRAFCALGNFESKTRPQGRGEIT